jgi:CdiI immunity protein
MTYQSKKPFDPENYPALQEFLPAYLHEDFTEEYGSAQDALKAFLADANGDQILAVKDEWHTLAKSLEGHPLADVQSALSKLGSVWLPQNEAEWTALGEILSRAEA